jgi:hypothetical protein
MARIAFVTSRIAPGTDGVGDHVRTLAGEIARMGHECVVIGLNQDDAHPWAERFGADGEPTPIRPSSTEARERRFAEARALVAAFDPQVVSFHYVSFAYARRGLAVDIGRRFREIAGKRRVELNAHELWTGFDLAATAKDRVNGFLQYVLFRRMLRQLAPDVIHVSNPTYVEMMRQIGRTVRLAPLFGNVPLTGALPAPDAEGFEEPAGQVWRLLFFGSIHAEWPPEPFLTRLTALAASEGRRPVVISVGRIGGGQPVWDRMIATHGHHCRFVRLGERPAAKISAIFNGVDFGVSTSPMCLIGKSSTVAAMLEHGLPVIVNREYPLRGLPLMEPPEGYARFVRLDDRFESAVKSAIGAQRLRASRLPQSALRFLTDVGIGS